MQGYIKEIKKEVHGDLLKVKDKKKGFSLSNWDRKFYNKYFIWITIPMALAMLSTEVYNYNVNRSGFIIDSGYIMSLTNLIVGILLGILTYGGIFSLLDFRNTGKGDGKLFQLYKKGVWVKTAILLLVISLLVAIIFSVCLGVTVIFALLSYLLLSSLSQISIIATGTVAVSFILLVIASMIYLLLGFVSVPVVYYHNKNGDVFEIIKESFSTIKNNRWEYIVLQLSLLGYYILSLITLGVIGLLYTFSYTGAVTYLYLDYLYKGNSCKDDVKDFEKGINRVAEDFANGLVDTSKYNLDKTENSEEDVTDVIKEDKEANESDLDKSENSEDVVTEIIKDDKEKNESDLDIIDEDNSSNQEDKKEKD